MPRSTLEVDILVPGATEPIRYLSLCQSRVPLAPPQECASAGHQSPPANLPEANALVAPGTAARRRAPVDKLPLLPYLRHRMMVRPRFSIFDFLIYLFLILLSLSFLYPIANQLALSISDAGELGWQGVTVIPVGFSTDSYRALLSSDVILRYYINTIKYASVGTFIMIATTSLMGVPAYLPRAAWPQAGHDPARHHDIFLRRLGALLSTGACARIGRYDLGTGASQRHRRLERDHLSHFLSHRSRIPAGVRTHRRSRSLPGAVPDRAATLQAAAGNLRAVFPGRFLERLLLGTDLPARSGQANRFSCFSGAFSFSSVWRASRIPPPCR